MKPGVSQTCTKTATNIILLCRVVFVCCVVWCGVVCGVCCLGCRVSFFLVEVFSHDGVQQRFVELIVKFFSHDMVKQRLEELIIKVSFRDWGSTAFVGLNIVFHVFPRQGSTAYVELNIVFHVFPRQGSSAAYGAKHVDFQGVLPGLGSTAFYGAEHQVSPRVELTSGSWSRSWICLWCQCHTSWNIWQN